VRFGAPINQQKAAWKPLKASELYLGRDMICTPYSLKTAKTQTTALAICRVGAKVSASSQSISV
jgi:hypothetical protein